MTRCSSSEDEGDGWRAEVRKVNWRKKLRLEIKRLREKKLTYEADAESEESRTGESSHSEEEQISDEECIKDGTSNKNGGDFDEKSLGSTEENASPFKLVQQYANRSDKAETQEDNQIDEETCKESNELKAIDDYENVHEVENEENEVKDENSTDSENLNFKFYFNKELCSESDRETDPENDRKVSAIKRVFFPNKSNVLKPVLKPTENLIVSHVEKGSTDLILNPTPGYVHKKLRKFQFEQLNNEKDNSKIDTNDVTHVRSKRQIGLSLKHKILNQARFKNEETSNRLNYRMKQKHKRMSVRKLVKRLKLQDAYNFLLFEKEKLTAFKKKLTKWKQQILAKNTEKLLLDETEPLKAITNNIESFENHANEDNVSLKRTTNENRMISQIVDISDGYLEETRKKDFVSKKRKKKKRNRLKNHKDDTDHSHEAHNNIEKSTTITSKTPVPITTLDKKAVVVLIDLCKTPSSYYQRYLQTQLPHERNSKKNDESKNLKTSSDENTSVNLTAQESQIPENQFRTEDSATKHTSETVIRCSKIPNDIKRKNFASYDLPKGICKANSSDLSKPAAAKRQMKSKSCSKNLSLESERQTSMTNHNNCQQKADVREEVKSADIEPQTNQMKDRCSKTQNELQIKHESKFTDGLSNYIPAVKPTCTLKKPDSMPSHNSDERVILHPKSTSVRKRHLSKDQRSPLIHTQIKGPKPGITMSKRNILENEKSISDSVGLTINKKVTNLRSEKTNDPMSTNQKCIHSNIDHKLLDLRNDSSRKDLKLITSKINPNRPEAKTSCEDQACEELRKKGSRKRSASTEPQRLKMKTLRQDLYKSVDSRGKIQNCSQNFSLSHEPYLNTETKSNKIKSLIQTKQERYVTERLQRVGENEAVKHSEPIVRRTGRLNNQKISMNNVCYNPTKELDNANEYECSKPIDASYQNSARARLQNLSVESRAVVDGFKKARFDIQQSIINNYSSHLQSEPGINKRCEDMNQGKTQDISSITGTMIKMQDKRLVANNKNISRSQLHYQSNDEIHPAFPRNQMFRNQEESSVLLHNKTKTGLRLQNISKPCLKITEEKYSVIPDKPHTHSDLTATQQPDLDSKLLTLRNEHAGTQTALQSQNSNKKSLKHKTDWDVQLCPGSTPKLKLKRRKSVLVKPYSSTERKEHQITVENNLISNSIGNVPSKKCDENMNVPADVQFVKKDHGSLYSNAHELKTGSSEKELLRISSSSNKDQVCKTFPANEFLNTERLPLTVKNKSLENNINRRPPPIKVSIRLSDLNGSLRSLLYPEKDKLTRNMISERDPKRNVLSKVMQESEVNTKIKDFSKNLLGLELKPLVQCGNKNDQLEDLEKVDEVRFIQQSKKQAVKTETHIKTTSNRGETMNGNHVKKVSREAFEINEANEKITKVLGRPLTNKKATTSECLKHKPTIVPLAMTPKKDYNKTVTNSKDSSSDIEQLRNEHIKIFTPKKLRVVEEGENSNEVDNFSHKNPSNSIFSKTQNQEQILKTLREDETVMVGNLTNQVSYHNKGIQTELLHKAIHDKESSTDSFSESAKFCKTFVSPKSEEETTNCTRSKTKMRTENEIKNLNEEVPIGPLVGNNSTGTYPGYNQRVTSEAFKTFQKNKDSTKTEFILELCENHFGLEPKSKVNEFILDSMTEVETADLVTSVPYEKESVTSVKTTELKSTFLNSSNAFQQVECSSVGIMTRDVTSSEKTNLEVEVNSKEKKAQNDIKDAEFIKVIKTEDISDNNTYISEAKNIKEVCVRKSNSRFFKSRTANVHYAIKTNSKAMNKIKKVGRFKYIRNLNKRNICMEISTSIETQLETKVQAHGNETIETSKENVPDSKLQEDGHEFFKQIPNYNGGNIAFKTKDHDISLQKTYETHKKPTLITDRHSENVKRKQMYMKQCRNNTSLTYSGVSLYILSDANRTDYCNPKDGKTCNQQQDIVDTFKGSNTTCDQNNVLKNTSLSSPVKSDAKERVSLVQSESFLRKTTLSAKSLNNTGKTDPHRQVFNNMFLKRKADKSVDICNKKSIQQVFDNSSPTKRRAKQYQELVSLREKQFMNSGKTERIFDSSKFEILPLGTGKVMQLFAPFTITSVNDCNHKHYFTLEKLFVNYNRFQDKNDQIVHTSKIRLLSVESVRYIRLSLNDLDTFTSIIDSGMGNMTLNMQSTNFPLQSGIHDFNGGILSHELDTKHDSHIKNILVKNGHNAFLLILSSSSDGDGEGSLKYLIKVIPDANITNPCYKVKIIKVDKINNNNDNLFQMGASGLTQGYKTKVLQVKEEQATSNKSYVEGDDFITNDFLGFQHENYTLSVTNKVQEHKNPITDLQPKSYFFIRGVNVSNEESYKITSNTKESENKNDHITNSKQETSAIFQMQFPLEDFKRGGLTEDDIFFIIKKNIQLHLYEFFNESNKMSIKNNINTNETNENDLLKSDFVTCFRILFGESENLLFYKVGSLLLGSMLEVKKFQTSSLVVDIRYSVSNEAFVERRRVFKKLFVGTYKKICSNDIDEDLHKLLVCTWFIKVYLRVLSTSLITFSLLEAKLGMICLLPLRSKDFPLLTDFLSKGDREFVSLCVSVMELMSECFTDNPGNVFHQVKLEDTTLPVIETKQLSQDINRKSVTLLKQDEEKRLFAQTGEEELVIYVLNHEKDGVCTNNEQYKNNQTSILFMNQPCGSKTMTKHFLSKDKTRKTSAKAHLHFKKAQNRFVHCEGISMLKDTHIRFGRHPSLSFKNLNYLELMCGTVLNKTKISIDDSYNIKSDFEEYKKSELVPSFGHCSSPSSYASLDNDSVLSANVNFILNGHEPVVFKKEGSSTCSSKIKELNDHKRLQNNFEDLSRVKDSKLAVRVRRKTYTAFDSCKITKFYIMKPKEDKVMSGAVVSRKISCLNIFKNASSSIVLNKIQDLNLKNPMGYINNKIQHSNEETFLDSIFKELKSKNEFSHLGLQNSQFEVKYEKHAKPLQFDNESKPSFSCEYNNHLNNKSMSFPRKIKVFNLMKCEDEMVPYCQKIGEIDKITRDNKKPFAVMLYSGEPSHFLNIQSKLTAPQSSSSLKFMKNPYKDYLNNTIIPKSISFVENRFFNSMDFRGTLTFDSRVMCELAFESKLCENEKNLHLRPTMYKNELFSCELNTTKGSFPGLKHAEICEASELSNYEFLKTTSKKLISIKVYNNKLMEIVLEVPPNRSTTDRLRSSITFCDKLNPKDLECVSSRSKIKSDLEYVDGFKYQKNIDPKEASLIRGGHMLTESMTFSRDGDNTNLLSSSTLTGNKISRRWLDNQSQMLFIRSSSLKSFPLKVNSNEKVSINPYKEIPRALYPKKSQDCKMIFHQSSSAIEYLNDNDDETFENKRFKDGNKHKRSLEICRLNNLNDELEENDILPGFKQKSNMQRLTTTKTNYSPEITNTECSSINSKNSLDCAANPSSENITKMNPLESQILNEQAPQKINKITSYTEGKTDYGSSSISTLREMDERLRKQRKIVKANLRKILSVVLKDCSKSAKTAQVGCEHINPTIQSILEETQKFKEKEDAILHRKVQDVLQDLSSTSESEED